MTKPEVERKYTRWGPRIYIDWGWHDMGDHAHDVRCKHQLSEDDAEKLGMELLKGTGEPVDILVSPTLTASYAVVFPHDAAGELDAHL